jgi:hypothetical protein
MAEKKRQHYVSKFYLKLFSWDDKKLINIYNISRKQIIHNGALEKQCYEDYFYGKDLVIENSLGTIENAVPSIIENIIFRSRGRSRGRSGSRGRVKGSDPIKIRHIYATSFQAICYAFLFRRIKPCEPPLISMTNC